MYTKEEVELLLAKHQVKLDMFFFDSLGKMERSDVDYRDNLDKENIEYPCTLCLDPNTHTGFAIFDNQQRLIVGGILISSVHTSTIKYKDSLNVFLNYLIEVYNISKIIYEEVFLGKSVSAYERLIEIRSVIKQQNLSYEKVEIIGIENTTWKKELAKPNKFKKSASDKDEINKYVGNMYPLILAEKKSYYQQDMLDAIGIGIAMIIKTTFSGQLYHKARYDKSLPIEQKAIVLDKPLPEEKANFEQFIQKQNKVFRLAYDVGGHIVVEENIGNFPIQEVARRYLTHKDALHITKINKTYKQWAQTLLSLNVSLAEYPNNELPEIYILSARKKRK